VIANLEQITPVPILQRDGEFDVLLAMYVERKPMRVLEVGTYHGGTLYHWLRLAQPGAIIVSLDSYATEVDNRHLYREWTPEGVTLEVIEGDSRDLEVAMFISTWRPYDWVFIDAGHFYDEVASDWRIYGPLAAGGGVVCFHDINYAGVAALWAEIKAEHETTELVSDPTTEWHGIGCVFL
jgi:cephalosporin hydroxylase